ncbi:MAG: hypothetical protein R3D32_01215 [Nitratireductor sp.]
MTPTLMGRWQTRIILFFIVGLPVTLLFALAWTRDFSDPGFTMVFLVLMTIFLVGMVLDPAYILVQSLRWENDWPFAFQLFFSICEFLVVLALIAADWLPFAHASVIDDPEMRKMLFSHFAVVVTFSILALLGPLQVFLPRWRYKGGEVGRL